MLVAKVVIGEVSFNEFIKTVLASPSFFISPIPSVSLLDSTKAFPDITLFNSDTALPLICA